ncbi:hypothetical protein ACFC01_17870 [Streptomyces mirabilis]|uniref:hypothetical protein n=1 Tax=Streptomyces mirabilis TaxID=68239 RepID=UPI0035E1094B
MSARDDLDRALREAYGTGVVFDGLTVADVTTAALAEEWLNAADLLSQRGYELPSDLLRRRSKSLRGEKASAPAPTATPAVFDPLPSYLHSIGQAAASQYERDLYAAYRQAIAEVARLQAKTGGRS